MAQFQNCFKSTYGIVEEHSVLGDNSNMASQARLRHVANVLVVHQNRTGLDIEKPEKQSHDCSLSTSGWSDDGAGLPGVHHERDILQDRPLRTESGHV